MISKCGDFVEVKHGVAIARPGGCVVEVDDAELGGITIGKRVEDTVVKNADDGGGETDTEG